MMRVLFVSAEASPFAQTGGLGEVCGSLPKALAASGCEVRLLLPAYGSIRQRYPELQRLRPLAAPGLPADSALLGLPLAPGLELWLVDAPALFDRPGGLYSDEHGRDWHDNAWRFAAFAQAAAALAQAADWRPDIVHCHDWQTALTPALLAAQAARPATVFTIHNLAFRGLCDRHTFEQLQLPAEWWDWRQLEFHGQCAFIKGGLAFADRLTTVSPGYAAEIRTPEFGYGLDGLLRHRGEDLIGILNGIDTAVWDPATDPHLRARYDAGNPGGRAVNKAALQTIFELAPRPDACLLGVVSRLTDQKGIDLLLAALRDPATADLQCAILGSGEPWLEDAVRALVADFPGRIGARFGYDTALSHLVYGGIDAFAMPSRFEPCGLSQFYSLRYGAVPVVRHTGGLADSVREGPDGNGLVFHAPTVPELLAALNRLGALWRDPSAWRALQARGMAQDFSWDQSAARYLALYRSLHSAEHPTDAPAVA